MVREEASTRVLEATVEMLLVKFFPRTLFIIIAMSWMTHSILTADICSLLRPASTCCTGCPPRLNRRDLWGREPLSSCLFHSTGPVSVMELSNNCWLYFVTIDSEPVKLLYAVIIGRLEKLPRWFRRAFGKDQEPRRNVARYC